MLFRSASSNEATNSFTTLTATMDITIAYDATGMTMARETQIQLYKYNHAKGIYEVVVATLDTANNRVTARIKEAGHYVLMTNL